MIPSRPDFNNLPLRNEGIAQYYRTYEDYAWTPFYKDNPEYGEIHDGGGCYGDRSAVMPLTNGCVYILKGKELKQAYVVSEGMYQQVEVTPSDVSHTKKVGSPRPYMVIKKFFPQNDSGDPEDYYVLVSEIKLSKKRLFESDGALTKRPDPRAKRISYSRQRLEQTEKDRRSGPRIFADYQKRIPTPDLFTYDFHLTYFDGVEGFHLLVPDIAKETRRRSDLYRNRLMEYQKWFNGERRSEEVYIAQAIESIIRQDPGKESYLDKKKLDAWKEEDSKQYRQRFFPLHYAIESLVYWLEHPFFKSFLQDYSCGNDEEQEAGVTLCGDSIRDIHYTDQGAQYLKREYDDRLSYFNQTTRLLDLKQKYSDAAATSSMYFELRKWSNVGFAFLEEFTAVIVAKEGEKARELFLELVYKKTGERLKVSRVKPVEHLEKYVALPDINQASAKFSHWPETRSGRGVITCIEGLNVALAFNGLLEAKPGEEKIKGTINLTGAVLDFMSSNWLVKEAVNRLAKTQMPLAAKAASKAIYRMTIASGIIDCMLGTWEMKLACQRGDYDVMISWGVFALGGAIIAVGTGLAMAGKAVTIGSAGVLSVKGGVLVVVGLIVEAIGLLAVFLLNNNEIDNWLARCCFGRKPAGTSNRGQLQELNDILCKFEVKADFKDIPGKFENLTCVTLKIEPRVMTRRSRITLTSVQGLAKARFAEMINPFGSPHDLRMGMQSIGTVVCDIDKLAPADLSEKDGRITEVRLALPIFNMDIDEVRGQAKLDMNNGTLQGYSREFDVRV